MYWVYVLYSKKFNKRYTGFSDYVNKRLVQHNSGRVKSTKPYLPYEVIYTEDFLTKEEAIQREKYLKTSNGRRELNKILSRKAGTDRPDQKRAV